MKTNNIPKKSNWGDKLTKRIIGMVLSIAMLTSMVSVFAEDVGSKADYVVTYSAEEITDFDTLLEMALEQQASSNSRSSQGQLTATSDSLVAQQLLETRLYNDGHTENDYVATAIVTPVVNQDQQTGGSGSGVSVSHQMYYSAYGVGDPPFNQAIFAKINYISTTIVSNLSNANVTITQGYNMLKEQGVIQWTNLSTTYNAVNNYAYQLFVSSSSSAGAPQFLPVGATSTIYSHCGISVNGVPSLMLSMDLKLTRL